MPVPVRPTSAAAADLIAAHDWYELRSPGLGKDFVRQVDTAILRLLRRASCRMDSGILHDRRLCAVPGQVT